MNEKIYHYIFGVRANSSLEKERSFDLDGMIEYTTEDIEKTGLIQDMINNELWKTEPNEAIQACGLTELFWSIRGLLLRATVNMFTIHHIYSDFQMDRDMIQMWLRGCEVDESSRKKLVDSEINKVKRGGV